jgi:low affinity Fe/Cu permease
VTRRPMRRSFSIFASAVNRFVSSAAATGVAFTIVVVWAIFGPITHYSEGWQLIITAINAKLDSLILAIERADNRLVGLELLPITEAEAVAADVKDVQGSLTGSPS